MAEAILKGALLRNESRGAHYKPQFPDRDDTNFLKATFAHLRRREQLVGDRVRAGGHQPGSPAARTYGKKVEPAAAKASSAAAPADAAAAGGLGRHLMSDSPQTIRSAPDISPPPDQPSIQPLEPDRTRIRPAHWVLLGIILIAALALRLHRLGAEGLWVDELASVCLSGGYDLQPPSMLPRDVVIESPPDFARLDRRRRSGRSGLTSSTMFIRRSITSRCGPGGMRSAAAIARSWGCRSSAR